MCRYDGRVLIYSGCCISDLYERYRVGVCSCVKSMHLGLCYNTVCLCISAYMLRHSNLIWALRRIFGRWVSQCHVTSAGIQGSAHLVPPLFNPRVHSREKDLPYSFLCSSVHHFYLYLMELSTSLTTKKRWSLALCVLRLRHRALRNR